MSSELADLRIACVHLYDDFSGSAKVFSHAIAVLKASGANVRVTVGSAGESGFIRAVHPAQTVWYQFSENRVVLLLWFLTAQLLLFMNVLRSCLWWRADVVYANTVLTPGAVLAAWMCRRRVVVHLHEVSRNSRVLFRMVMALLRKACHQLICVSNYMREALDLPDARTTVVYDSLPPDEWAKAIATSAEKVNDETAPFVVLMVSSLKWYKGLDSFLALARRFEAQNTKLPRLIHFRLVLNCDIAYGDRFLARSQVPANVAVVLRPPDIYKHYGEAALVLNLSHREACIETFGMTLLEAMACGTPVVGPEVGGCSELFAEGAGGWHVDSRNLDALATLVRDLASDRSRWCAASQAARTAAARFHPDGFSYAMRTVMLAAGKKS